MNRSWKSSRQSFDEPASEVITTAVLTGRVLGDDTTDIARANRIAERRVRSLLYKAPRPVILRGELTRIRIRSAAYLRDCASRARAMAARWEQKADEIEQADQSGLWEWQKGHSSSRERGRCG